MVVKVEFGLESDDDFNQQDYYIVVDTYAFSTTVTTALENDTINQVQTAMELEDLSKYDFPTGGEMDQDTTVKNCPLLFSEQNFNRKKVGLTSDNGAKRVHQLLEKGVENIVLGCLRNAESIADKLDSEETVHIVPADRSDVPTPEDYLTQAVISNHLNGFSMDESEGEFLRNKAMQFVDEEGHTQRDIRRWVFCTRVNASLTVPTHDSDGLFASWE